MSTFSVPINDIYLTECIVYFFIFLATIVLLIKQFQDSKVVWSYVLLFCTLKIVGSAINLYVGSEEAHNEIPSTGLVVAGLICLNIAVGPLLLVARLLMQRGCKDMNPEGSSLISPGRKRTMSGVLILATALSIAGFSLQVQAGGSAAGRALIKAGALLYLVSYLALFILAIVSFRALGTRFNPNMVSFLYFFLALTPFYLARLIYSIICAFVQNTNVLAYHTFSVFNGNWKVYLVMVVLMEVSITVSYCVVGYIMESKIQTNTDKHFSEPDKQLAV